MNDDGSRFEDSSPRAARHRQEAILITMCFRQIEATNDPESAIGYDAPFHFAGRLLRSNQNNTQTSPAFGNVEQYFLNWTPTLAWGVLVQFIQDDENQRTGGARGLFVLKHSPKHHADHESLCTVVEVVNINDSNLLLLPSDSSRLRLVDLNRTSNQMADMELCRSQTPLKGRNGSSASRNLSTNFSSNVAAKASSFGRSDTGK